MRTLLLVTLLVACGNDGPADNHHPPDASVPACGDGTRDPSEECDGADLGGKSCSSLGLGAGALHCSSSCALDTSSCHAACTPRTCAAVGAECGAIDDGCGNPLACGSCTGTETCGGGGHPNQCGMGTCQTHACAMVGAECGTIDDGCGHALACGTCTGTDTCGGGGVPNQCGSTTTPPSPWIQIATGSWHTCGIRQDGTLWCWGRNNAGQLGLGTSGDTETTPQQVGTSHGWTKITAGSQHTCGIQFAHMYCWGRNDSNQLGDNTTTDRVSPTLIASAMEWNDVTAGFASTCAWNTTFEVYCWGNNDYQQIADALGPVPVPMYRATGVEYLSLGGGHQCWQYSPDNLYCRGLNTSFQLGANVSAQWSTTGHVVTPESNWQWHGVFAGGRHTCAFGFVGTLVCWGDNQYGQLGNPGATASLPDYVDGLTDWAAVGMGDSHTCGIKTNGNLLCWGANDAGQIGDTTHVDRNSPVLIGSGWASVAGGFSHTCALRSDQKLYCWGDNTYGALGFAGGSVAAPHEVP